MREHRSLLDKDRMLMGLLIALPTSELYSYPLPSHKKKTWSEGNGL